MMTLFHERLKELRELSGKTQAEIAESIGIPPQNLSYYFNGREPNFELLIKLANYFNVSTDHLLGRTNDKGFDDSVNKLDVEIREKTISAFCELRDVLKDCIENHHPTTPPGLKSSDYKLIVMTDIMKKVNKLFRLNLNFTDDSREQRYNQIVAILDIDREMSDKIREIRNNVELDYMLG